MASNIEKVNKILFIYLFVYFFISDDPFCECTPCPVDETADFCTDREVSNGLMTFDNALVSINILMTHKL